MKSLAGPYPKVRFCPTGGLTPDNFREFLDLPNVICCGGSWMVADKLAREGKEVERQPRTVTIHSLDLLNWEKPVLEFRVHCSKGTYVRTLAEDIAGALGSCAHLKALRRTKVGPFREMGMIELGAVERAAENGSLDSLLLPVDSGLENWPLVVLEDEAASRFTHGNPVPVSEQQIGPVRIYSEQEHLLGLGELRADCKIYPKRVFVW